MSAGRTSTRTTTARWLRPCAREFAEDIDDGTADAHAAIPDLLGTNEGLAVQALERHWSKVKGTHLANLAEAGRLAATALDGVAVLIEGAKLAAIAQLGILAAEIAAAVAAAPVTLGLSTLAGLAGTQAPGSRSNASSRRCVRRLPLGLSMSRWGRSTSPSARWQATWWCSWVGTPWGCSRASTSARPRRRAGRH
ncbi:hypothetical protein AB0L74_31915 [Streptomyces sp. NPDC052020]|uniref:hypothetical protein n=1 Tax=Streptomyces sp. NPDC052020 TaxID=3155677 RepID=UPI00342AFB5A